MARAWVDRHMTPSERRGPSVASGAGTGWLIGRAPRDEVLLGLVMAPAAVGVAGLVVARDNRWPALAFLAVAGMLTALIASVWLARQAA